MRMPLWHNIANGLGEKSLDLTSITVKGRLVVWGGSAVNITGKSTVAGVVTPRNDGPVQVVFDAAATELSQKGCSIVKRMTNRSIAVWTKSGHCMSSSF